MEADEVLDRAADLLMIYGRCTGKATDAAGRFCVNGAMNEAFLPGSTLTSLSFTGPGGRELCVFLAAHPEWLDEVSRDTYADYLEEGRFPAWIWNDHLRGEGSDEFVIDTLRRCAKELRG